MKKMYDESEVKQIALDSIGAYYDVDDLRFENQVTFDENVVIDGELSVGGEKIGSIAIHDGAPSEVTTSELRINKNLFSDGTYTIDITDGNNDLDFTGIIQVVDRTDVGLQLRGLATNYDCLSAEVVVCVLQYENNKIIIQLMSTDGSFKSFDPDFDYNIRLIKIA